ncbi:MAG: hypothetical protein GY765_02790 [bacterium]|nr:hypothetical protein [bacterium]
MLVIFLLCLYLSIRGNILLTSPPATPFFEDYRGRFISEGWGSDSPKGYWTIDKPLPQRIKSSFLAIEDKRFYEHNGVDWYAIGRAVVNNFSSGPRHGASTIAMQVARMQQPGKRSYWKKLCETITARLLVRKYGRKKILAHYMALVPMGNRIHGVSYAARRYFRKPLQDLGWAESAILAALPKAPGRMNVFSYQGFEIARKRAGTVLNLLLEQQKLNKENYDAACRHLAALRPPVRETRPYHSFHALLNLERNLKTSGVSVFHRPVRCALDLELQEYLSFISLNVMGRLRELGAGNIALMVVERETGKVRGYLGSEYYYDKANAGAIDYGRVARSSGSTLKPFIYALGLGEGVFRASSVLADLPFFVIHGGGQYLVQNYDSRFLGPMLYRKALANSRNVPAVEVLRKVGVDKAHAFLKQLGLERSDREGGYYGLGLAIGGLYVNLQDLVGAYGVLANEGKSFSLNWFSKARRAKLETQEHTNSFSPAVQTPPRVAGPLVAEGETSFMSEDIARQIALHLSDPLSRLPSFPRMGALEYPFPVAVKTGTSQGFRDAWTVAWSDRYIVGAWIGHANNDAMKKVNGLEAAAVVKEVMLHLHPEEKHGVGETPFPPPRGFKVARLCSHSGEIAGEVCSDIVLEYFKPGTQPVSQCSVHRKIAIDRRTGKLASKTTPTKDIRLKTFTSFPPRYVAWAASNGYEKPPQAEKTLPVATLEISNPVHRSRIMLDPETPRRFQTLPLKAKVTPAVSNIIWIVDGKEKKPTAYPYVYRWPLEPGEHTFQARFPRANVRSEVVTVSVTEY